ncbi:MAG: type IV pilin N-terminal domain-containing protein [Methanoregula sp.]|nr:type IV pilin N-terminal domain-containing protein [Methanoregula sp.]
MKRVGYMKHTVEKREDAVSPVVGVMLMLVVVIIIAAVVSAFAGGLATKEQKAPVAILDVDINSLENAGDMPPWGDGYYVPTMTIRHVSGDPLQTKDLKIITYFQNRTGSKAIGMLQGEQAVAGNDAWISYTSSQYIGVFFINDPKRFGTGAVQDTKGKDNWFGNASAVLQTGDILTSPAQFCGNYNDDTGPTQPHVNTGMNYLFGFNVSDPANGFRPGASADVKIVHIPSGKYIYDEKVVLQ